MAHGEDVRKGLVVVPTFNEAENIGRLIPDILRQDPRLEVLVVDDGSPDGTAGLVKGMMATDPRIHILERPQKMGLGTAYVAGFRYALSGAFDVVFEMDADFSHDPRELPRFLEASGSSTGPWNGSCSAIPQTRIRGSRSGSRFRTPPADSSVSGGLCWKRSI